MNVSTSGINLFSRKWEPKSNEINSIVFIAHGWAEHSDWYEEFAQFLNKNNILCAIHDHVGHGKSEGRRGHVFSIRVLMEDVVKHCQMLKNEYPDKKLFLFGHSMGGLISCLVAIEHPQLVNGIILSAPYLSTGSVSKIGGFFVKLAANILPRLVIDDSEEECYRDPEAVARALNDKLYYNGGISALTAQQFIEYTSLVQTRVKEFVLPVLCIHGVKDACIDYKMSKWFCDECGSTDKKFLKIDEAFHNLMNEPDDVKLKLYDDIKNWILQRLGQIE